MERKHAWALFFALIVGSISVAPTILATFALGDAYRGIEFSNLADEDVYRARIHEILDGHGAVTSPFFYEYKDSSLSLMPPIGESFYALPSALIGIAAVVVLSKFLLPALLFFLVYLLMRRLTGDDNDDFPARLNAIVAGLLVVLGYDLINYKYLIPTLQGLQPAIPVLWTRLVNPIVGGVEMFGFLCLLWSIQGGKRSWLLVASAGALLALTVGYFFSFGISLAVLAVLFGISVIEKEYKAAWSFSYVFLISFVLEIPYWYYTLLSVGSPEGEALAERNGMFFTHTPVLNKMLLLATVFVLISAAYAYWIKKDLQKRSSWLFIGGLLLASWLAFNQQIITGREIWYHHFVQYTIPISLIAILVASFLSWRIYFPRLWTLGICLLGGLSLWVGLLGVTGYASQMDAFRGEQHYADVTEWLNANAPKDCVVLIRELNEELERLIPAYTSCNVYNSTVTFGIPQGRILHNYLLRLRLMGVMAPDIHEYLLSHPGEIHNYFFENWNQMLAQDLDPWVLGKIPVVESAYQQFLKEDLKTEMQRYKIDYLLSKMPLPDSLQKNLGLQLVATPGQFFFYSF